MMKLPVALSLVLLLSPSMLAQKPSYMSAAEVRHISGSGTLTANDPRPLMQAVEAISEEYGWTLDYEDPPYQSHFDVVDVTAPEWRAAHPHDKGAITIAGGLFRSNFSEPSAENGEEKVLEKLVADYNASGNPGKFAVRKVTDSRYAIVGVSRRDEQGSDQAINALLDTPITLPIQPRDAEVMLHLILDTLAQKSGVNIKLGTIGFTSNPLQGASVTVGGASLPARTLLLQVLDGLDSSQHFQGIFAWNFLFDPYSSDYWLRLRSVTKAETDVSGKRVVEFVRRPTAKDKM